MVQTNRLRLIAGGLALLALVPVLLALSFSWAGYEADGRFSASGCSGDVADAEYHISFSTRTVHSTDGVDCPTTFILDYSDIAEQGSQISRARHPGMADLAQVLPLVLTGACLLIVATGAILWPKGRLAPLLGGALAVLAALGLIVGAVFFQVGAGAQQDWETTSPQGDLRDDPDAWTWGLGFYSIWSAGLLTAGAGVLAFVPPRKQDADDDPMGDEAPDADAHDPVDVEEGAPEPPIEAVGMPKTTERRPPRKLKCPRCEHKFLGEWGKQPVCPACGHGPRA